MTKGSAKWPAVYPYPQPHQIQIVCCPSAHSAQYRAVLILDTHYSHPQHKVRTFFCLFSYMLHIASLVFRTLLSMFSESPLPHLVSLAAALLAPLWVPALGPCQKELAWLFEIHTVSTKILISTTNKVFTCATVKEVCHNPTPNALNREHPQAKEFIVQSNGFSDPAEQTAVTK